MRAVITSILLLLISFAFAQLPEQLYNIPLPNDPSVLIGTLDNGIRYYIIENARPANRAELRLFVDAGSILEDEDQLGLAHFTEHMAFNGTKHFERSEVVDYLGSIGMGFANGLNAMTSYDFTMYQLKIPTDNKEQLEKGFLILSDMANKVSFLEDELERERGVIIEEWRMGQNAQSRISEKVMKVKFAGSRYAERTPIGTYDILSTFTRDEIVRFYKDWYRPDLQSVIVVGDIQKEEALALIKKYFADIEPVENPRVKEEFPVPNYPEARAVVATDPEYPYSTITASWSRERKDIKTIGDYFEELHEELFFAMLNARLEELSKQEDPPFSFAYGYSGSMLKGLASTDLMAYTASGKNREALRVLLTEAERIRRFGFQSSELARAKTKLLRQMQRQVEESSTRESDAIVWSIFSSLTDDSVILSAEQELELCTQLLNFVQIEAINSVVDELITLENLTISYTANDNPEIKHPTEAQLLQVYEEVLYSNIAPYEDTVVSQSLMEKKPKAGSIVKKKTYPKSEIREWTLSNGLKVYSKKTNFKSDEILYSAKSPGGYSRYSAADAYTAMQLGDYLSSSGLAEFDANELTRILSDKVVRSSLNVTTYHEGFSGSASPRDLEVLFQLIHLQATGARFDQKSLNSYINRTRPFLENVARDPSQAFFDSLSVYTNNHHPLDKAIGVEELEALKIEDLERIYRDRFADFGDFSFFFVGNFDEELFEEYVCTYLASLPKARRKDKIVDAGIRAFTGRSEYHFKKGSSESAQVAHITNGKIKLSDKNRTSISGMLLVLNEKLRENIRENLSGVYAIQAWQNFERYPFEQYKMYIYTACSPERVEELNKAIFATVDSLKMGLFDQKYVDAAKEVLKKRYEESISQNRYWLNNMMNNVLGDEDIDAFQNYLSLYEKIDKKSIQKDAQKYLNFDKKRLTLVMRPEVSMFELKEEKHKPKP